MADEDLTIKARIDDELSRPLEGIRDEVKAVGREAEDSSRRAGRGSRSWDLYGRATEKAGRLAHHSGRLIKGAALAVGAGITATAYAVGRLAVSSIDKASDLNESLNAVNVTYGKQAGAVKKLGREAAKSLGLSNTAYNGMAVQFASFAQTIGGKGPGSVKVLDKITTRAADFASVMNLEVAEATELFQSGLAGESEPLRKYGINLSAAAVQAYALSKGIIEGKEQLTDSQKVTATYGLLMEKTSKTAGDFTNTSDQLANQQRILSARMDNAQAKLGKGLLPVMQTGAKWLNREGVPAFLRFSDWFNDEGLPAIGRFVDKARTFYDEHGPQIKQTLGDVRDVAKQAAKQAGDLVDAFLGMPSWARKLLVGGLAGAVVAKKTGLAGAIKGLVGGGKGLAALATKAKPLPVWVVNSGGLPGDGPGGSPGGKASKWSRFLDFAGKGAKTTGPLAALGTLGGGLSIAGGSAGGLSLYGLSQSKKLPEAEANRRVAVGSPYGGVWTQVDMGPSEEDWERIGKAAEEYARTTDKAMDLARAKAAGFGKELDLVGARKVTPTVKADQIKAANDAWAKFTQYQIDAGRPVAPYISTTSIERAIEAARTLADTIHAIPTAGLDGGVNYISGGGASSAPSSSGGRGGRGGRGGNDTLPNAAERVVPGLEPRRAGRTAGGSSTSVTIAPGGVVVHNPASNVDVTKAIEDYVREREERR